jgi:hypothetical protein
MDAKYFQALLDIGVNVTVRGFTLIYCAAYVRIFYDKDLNCAQIYVKKLEADGKPITENLQLRKKNPDAYNKEN